MTARLVVMISGMGSNLRALMDTIDQKKLDAEIALVVSNRKDAFGLQIATSNQIDTLYFPLKPYNDAGKARTSYDADLAEKVMAYQPNLIVLAGWMHIFSTAFLDHFPNKVINLHPALPGTFPGRDAIQQAYAAFQRGDIKQSGCMVHYVVPEVDAGTVIRQIIVPFEPQDSLERFEARMRTNEHYLLPRAVKKALWEQGRSGETLDDKDSDRE